MVFQSPKKHKIITIEKLLSENNIPITGIHISTYTKWNHGIMGENRFVETRERSEELKMPIEDFNEKALR